MMQSCGCASMQTSSWGRKSLSSSASLLNFVARGTVAIVWPATTLCRRSRMREGLAAHQEGIAKSIPLVDLQAQRRRLGARIDDAVLRVCEHANFIMGKEVAEFERQLAQFCGARHALSCGNGTDALLLGLMAKDVGPGDAVFCPTFTFAATAEVIALLRATPVFVDVLEETFNIDPNNLGAAIDRARKAGLRPAGIIAVD